MSMESGAKHRVKLPPDASGSTTRCSSTNTEKNLAMEVSGDGSIVEVKYICIRYQICNQSFVDLGFM